MNPDDHDDLANDIDADEFEELELADLPGLQAASRFPALIERVEWFTAIGRPLDDDEIVIAQDYAAALGFPEVQIAAAGDWIDVTDIMGNPDWNSEAWEAEEQLRAALIMAACDLADEETVSLALTRVSQAAAEILPSVAETVAITHGLDDEELINLAVGAGVQACYQAALVLAAEVEDQEEHPFALKFRLFEMGRWPLGIIGATCHIF
jgi:hypothetical protein